MSAPRGDAPSGPIEPCESEADRGKLVHDEVRDIWYECLYDQRQQRFTWAIVPRAD